MTETDKVFMKYLLLLQKKCMVFPSIFDDFSNKSHIIFMKCLNK